MSKKKNVLIFSGATYPAMQIIECLKNSPRFHIIAGASYPNHSEYVCDDAIVDIPFINDPNFMDKFVQLVVDREIDFVIPTDETIAMVLKKHEEDIPAIVVCSPYETTRLCRYKSLTYKVLEGEIYVPKVYSDVDSIVEYPVFVKPDSSQGSKGAKLIKSAAELRYLEDINDMVICEYLPGEEYTVDCFTNKEGKLVFCNPRIRTRLMNGITARGKNIPYTEEFELVMNGLNSKIQFRGYWYAQLKRDKSNQLKLLEICTRFAGSFAISKGLGINLPLLSLCDFSGLPADVIANNYVVECDKTYIDRYRLSMEYNHVYVDYDDTITAECGEAVNPYVIAYLYQCRRKKISISLITRHGATFNERLEESFDRLGISEKLFDEIIELPWDKKKIDAMSNVKGSIFIDNSFAERKAVHDAFGIPVFDISNIDCLFDWRQ